MTISNTSSDAALGFLIGGDKAAVEDGHIRQVKILGYATKIPCMGIPQTLTRVPRSKK
jgi:hypothetical protein